MDADDVLNLNAFDEFYRISEEKNLDFLVFKAINYGVEKDHYFETEYQNMTSIYNKVKDNVFSYKDLGDLLFDFNVSPWCKFYNSEFIKSTGARFRENSKFHDNQFFWDIIFKAQRIYFINEFYYTRKRYDQSLTASGDIDHIDIIGVVNDIIKLFEKHDQLDNYKHILYNLKITWITDRYNQVQGKYKREFFNRMKNDFLSLKINEFPKLLDDDRRFIFDCAIISKNYNDFDLIKKYYSNKENSNKKINTELNNRLQEKENTVKELTDIVKNNEEKIKDLNNKVNDKEKIIADLNDRINENNSTINELNNKLQDKETTITELNHQIKNNKTTINELNNKLQDREKTIGELEDSVKNKDDLLNKFNYQINTKTQIIKNDTIKISRLETKNTYLNKKNYYLKNELDNRFSIKKLFQK